VERKAERKVVKEVNNMDDKKKDCDGKGGCGGCGGK
jgi:hypothetical protein